jgi:FtsP/CotA-like multicopper oxidase with cupredoxin domain
VVQPFPLQLDWFERRQGPVSRRGEVVEHANGWAACTPIADPNKAVNRRQFILDSSMCMTSNHPTEMQMAPVMCINGKSHDLARIDEEVKIGTTEIWEIFSVGMIHPFHVHGASFRIISINGQSPPAYLTG